MGDSDLARGEKRLMGGVGQAARAAYTDTCLGTCVGGHDSHGEMGAPLRLEDSPQTPFSRDGDLGTRQTPNQQPIAGCQQR